MYEKISDKQIRKQKVKKLKNKILKEIDERLALKKEYLMDAENEYFEDDIEEYFILLQLIPETLICSNMNTYGTYQKKRNRRNRNILTYEDGLKCEDWIKFNEDWLNEITEDKEIQGQIYYEFQKHDFR